MRPTRLLTATVAGVLAAFVAVGAPAFADELDDRRAAAEQRGAAADRQLEALEASIEGLDAQLGQAVLDLQATQSRLPAAQAELATAEEELERSQREADLIAARLLDATDQVARLTETIAVDEARGEEIRTAVGQMARRAYKGDTATSSLSVVMDAESTQEFVDQYGMVNTAMRTQTKALDELRQIEAANRNSQARLAAVRERVAELKIEADAKVVEADAARAAAAERKAEIENLIAQQAAQQAAIEGMKAQAEGQAAQVEAQRSSIESELQGIIAQERAAAQAAAARAATRPGAGGGSAASAASGAAQAPSGSVSGAMFSNPTSIRPMYVTSSYGPRLHPILGYSRLHAGTDLRTGCNTPLYAPRDGTVRWSQWRGGFGNQVMIDHGYVDGNSLMSSSNHLTRAVVSGGQRVTRGQLIGYAGNTGLSGACHLHFEVYINGATTDPRPLLGP
ncbi:peptidoglycan DD-metalloendopeptidase family protein [Cellulomonas sp. ATA003]|uniref:peptidoglycan DD-metalloendopeptidase family protein n=1 Tax=Cellulomonas sp. ATA003 TaxID=3073064 RepID=UPI002873ABFB|nr:peptidoglycan DD-metalloendopeptidase family protein [Cellulomonas sp. ATA003]WNB86429.1 peptidoglycan DD-metalloendopeptidase family protein [Cellulomonas sp. ATA003]